MYNGILLSHQKGWLPTIYIDVVGAGAYYAKWNKSVRERKLSYGFIHMWTIRNSVEDNRGKEGKLNGKKSVRETNCERLLSLGNKPRVAERRGGAGRGGGGRRWWMGAWGNWVTGIKEGLWCDEPWVLYATNESLHIIPKVMMYCTLANWI